MSMGNYLRFQWEIIKETCRTTWELTKAYIPLEAVVFIAGVGAGFYLNPLEFLEQWQNALVSGAVTIVAMFLIFLVSARFTAPYKLWRRQEIRLEALNDAPNPTADMPIREALLQVSGFRPADPLDDGGSVFSACKTLRQGALDQRITIWGREIISNVATSVLTKIDSSYWARKEIDTAVILDDNPQLKHTITEEAFMGFKDRAPDYTDLHVNRSQCKRLIE